MDASFWYARWESNRIGFHQDDFNRYLVAHWHTLGVPLDSRVLVPLCGKSLDLSWLDQEGHEVVGVEFVEQAARDYFEERGISAQRSVEHGRVSFRRGRTQIVVGDFFALSASELGPIDVVYDRAALVAIEPQRRVQYAKQLAALTPPGAVGLVISFEHDLDSGPPFSVPEVETLFAEAFEIDRVDQHDILRDEPRFAERGATQMDEVVWYLRRIAD